MAQGVDVARGLLTAARRHFEANVRSLTLDEALSAAGGYRSILGVLKHMGGWIHVYRSYAFDAEPAHWDHTSWPRGLRDTVEPTADYLEAVVAWVDAGLEAWEDALSGIDDAELDRPHRVHWGGTAPLAQIVVSVALEAIYHTGELNMLLSMARGEAWEYGEEVEENHIDTYGHGVRPPWMSDEQARSREEALRRAYLARGGASPRGPSAP